MSGSVQKALSATSLPHDEMVEIYAPFLSLTDRLLGAPPKFLALAHKSPLTHIFYLSALRTCFHIPECDLNLLRISTSVRRTALLESSIAHNCAYCTGHVAAMGDVLKGPMIAQCARRGSMGPAAADDSDVLKKLVSEVATFPGGLSKSTKEQFVAEYGEEGYTQIASMICFMGFLNYTMGAAGMQLESRMVPFAETAMKERSLPFKFRDIMKDDMEEHLGQEEVAKVKRRGMWGSAVENAKNAWGLVGLMGPVVSAGMREKKWFGNIPGRVDEMDAWCEKLLGTIPEVFEQVTDPVLKRSLALSIQLMFTEENTSWKKEQVCMFMFVLASGIMNDRLKEDALKLHDVKSSNGANEASVALSIARSVEKPTNAYEAALKFMHQCAGYADRVSEEAVRGLVEQVKEHGDIVDLVGMVGQFGFWHRASLFYPGVPE